MLIDFPLLRRLRAIDHRRSSFYPLPPHCSAWSRIYADAVCLHVYDVADIFIIQVWYTMLQVIGLCQENSSVPPFHRVIYLRYRHHYFALKHWTARFHGFISSIHVVPIDDMSVILDNLFCRSNKLNSCIGVYITVINLMRIIQNAFRPVLEQTCNIEYNLTKLIRLTQTLKIIFSYYGKIELHIFTFIVGSCRSRQQLRKTDLPVPLTP